MVALLGYVPTRDRDYPTDSAACWTGRVVAYTGYRDIEEQRPHRCPGSRQPNNLAMRVHWPHSKQRRIIRNGRKYVLITAPRRLQRGRNG